MPNSAETLGGTSANALESVSISDFTGPKYVKGLRVECRVLGRTKIGRNSQGKGHFGPSVRSKWRVHLAPCQNM
jgi:hypothetical protein